MRKHVIIVAGGAGTRLGGALPKQFQMLRERPLLWWSLKAFHDEDPSAQLHLVLPKQFFSLWKELEAELPESDRILHSLHPGGASRFESVQSALNAIAEEESLVAVHDAARPLVSRDVIEAGWETAGEKGAGVPVVAVTDSLRRLDGDSSHAVDRSLYVAVQTPQVFQTRLLKEAYKRAEGNSFTDDASVVEANGVVPSLFKGSHTNIKVTNPGDLEIATLLLPPLS